MTTINLDKCVLWRLGYGGDETPYPTSLKAQQLELPVGSYTE